MSDLAAKAAPPTRLDLAARYRRVAGGRLAILLALVLAIVCSLVLDLHAGPATLGFSDVVYGLLDPDTLSVRDRVVLWSVRLPDALIALAVGTG